MNKVPPKAMFEDSPGDAPVTISLRRVKELAASNRKHAMADMNHGLLTVSMTETDTAAALEALVKLVRLVDNADMDHGIDCPVRTRIFSHSHECDCGVHPLQDALEQFIDDREKP